MAYVEPKTNWVTADIPVAADLNRIEGNTKQNHEDIVTESASRLAGDNAEALARSNAISSEALTRGNADTAETLARTNADAAIQTALDIAEADIASIKGALGIGSFAMARPNNSSTYNYGNTISGADLYLCSSSGTYISLIGGGTWICRGFSVGGTANNADKVTLWMRTA